MGGETQTSQTQTTTTHALNQHKSSSGEKSSMCRTHSMALSSSLLGTQIQCYLQSFVISSWPQLIRLTTSPMPPMLTTVQVVTFTHPSSNILELVWPMLLCP